MIGEIDERFLDYLKDDRLSDDHKKLLADIKCHYRTVFKLKIVDKSPNCDKAMFVMIYNLLAIGYVVEPILMLSLIDPSYYKKHLMNDLREAVGYLQQAEDRKNRVDAASKTKVVELRELGEFVQVVIGMTNFLLERVGPFPGREDFFGFVDELRFNPPMVTIRPVISLVKQSAT